MSEQAGILIVSRDERRQSAWLDALRGLVPRVWLPEQKDSHSGTLDVVLTDQSDLGGIPPELVQRLEQDEIGIVRVAATGPADVHLPADATPREIHLACTLLAQVVRLRRDRNESLTLRRVLSDLAHRDPLTGLPNRRAWDEQLAARCSASLSGEMPICLALLDLDHFKQVNDVHGHAAGDRVLQAAARSLAAAVRTGDLVARWGGDEFALLLAAVEAHTAWNVVDRARRAIAHGQSPTLPVTASGGFAISSDVRDTTELVALADEALRRAKTAGRNRTEPRA